MNSNKIKSEPTDTYIKNKNKMFNLKADTACPTSKYMI